MILRYSSPARVISRLDPIDDLISCISGLRSKAVVEDILVSVHGFDDIDDTEEIDSTSKAVASHADYAVKLLAQGLGGPSEISFLSLYYSFLDLAKIMILLSGKRTELEKNRWHGVTYSINSPNQDLMDERIVIKEKGVIPLVYQVITGTTLTESSIELEMRSIYPLIRMVSYEYGISYRTRDVYVPTYLDIEGDDQTGYRLKMEIPDVESIDDFDLNHLQAVRGFTQDVNNKNLFYTPYHKRVSSHRLINRYIKRYLLASDVSIHKDDFVTSSPLLDAPFSFPEEIPLLLAFFHLSNIVRYNPEYMERLRDSRAWVILMSLLRQGTLTFLELFWSFTQQQEFKLSVE